MLTVNRRINRSRRCGCRGPAGRRGSAASRSRTRIKARRRAAAVRDPAEASTASGRAGHSADGAPVQGPVGSAPTVAKRRSRSLRRQAACAGRRSAVTVTEHLGGGARGRARKRYGARRGGPLSPRPVRGGAVPCMTTMRRSEAEEQPEWRTSLAVRVSPSTSSGDCRRRRQARRDPSSPLRGFRASPPGSRRELPPERPSQPAHVHA